MAETRDNGYVNDKLLKRERFPLMLTCLYSFTDVNNTMLCDCCRSVC